jgi:hypothetical protein
MTGGIERLISAALVALALGGCSTPTTITYHEWEEKPQEAADTPVRADNSLCSWIRYELYRKGADKVTFDEYYDAVGILAVTLWPAGYPMIPLLGAIYGAPGGERVIIDVEALAHGGLRVSKTKIARSSQSGREKEGRNKDPFEYRVSCVVIYDRDSNDIPDEDSFSADRLGHAQKPTIEEYQRMLVGCIERIK